MLLRLGAVALDVARLHGRGRCARNPSGKAGLDADHSKKARAEAHRVAMDVSEVEACAKRCGQTPRDVRLMPHLTQRLSHPRWLAVPRGATRAGGLQTWMP